MGRNVRRRKARKEAERLANLPARNVQQAGSSVISYDSKGNQPSNNSPEKTRSLIVTPDQHKRIEVAKPSDLRPSALQKLKRGIKKVFGR